MAIQVSGVDIDYLQNDHPSPEVRAVMLQRYNRILSQDYFEVLADIERWQANRQKAHYIDLRLQVEFANAGDRLVDRIRWVFQEAYLRLP